MIKFRSALKVASLIIAIVSIYNISYYVRAMPIASGYAAKIACSQVFIGKRDIADIIKNELNPFPQSLATAEINFEDKSATGSVFGFSKRKAIYRDGLGCTLISEISEDDLRKQKTQTPPLKSSDPENTPWPKGEKITDIPAGIDHDKLNQAIESVFEPDNSDPLVLKDSAAVVVLYDGKIIAEKYGKGQDKNSKHISWSMAKSITSALVGILVKQNKIDINAPLNLPEWQSDDRKDLTLTNLLYMESGLEWLEEYGGLSSVNVMLHEKKDMGAYAASFKLDHKIGEEFKYSSGTTAIINKIIFETVKQDNYINFLYNELFNQIDMNSAIAEYDPTGAFVGSSYFFATARDYARFALLYYQDGVWDNKRILPEGWVKFSITPSKSSKGSYGAQWWANQGGNKDEKSGLYFPSLPADTYSAMGYGGQFIVVIPSKKLIVVRLSHAAYKVNRTSNQKRLGMDKLVTEIISCLPQQNDHNKPTQ